MEIIRSAKGGPKLCLEVYIYTKKYASVIQVRWECSHRRAYSCSGGVATDLEVCSSHFWTTLSPSYNVNSQQGLLGKDV